MDLERLREIQNEERSSEKLKIVEPNFYEEIGEYVSKLRKKLEEIGDYDDAERDILEDEIRSVRRVVEDIFKLRLKKIIRSANFRANGLESDIEGLTPEEEELYEEIVTAISKARKRMLACLLGRVEEEKKIYRMDEKDEEAGTSSEDSENESEEVSEEKDYILVKVVKEIPPFVGVDGRSYSLNKEDVVMLPKEHVELLVQRNVVVPVKMR
jgi:DNA replication factor GINS